MRRIQKRRKKDKPQPKILRSVLSPEDIAWTLAQKPKAEPGGIPRFKSL